MRLFNTCEKPEIIAFDHEGHLLSYLYQTPVLLFGFIAERLVKDLHQLAQVEINRRRFYFPGIQLVEIEDIINDLQKAILPENCSVRKSSCWSSRGLFCGSSG